jgi:hypothetical protein
MNDFATFNAGCSISSLSQRGKKDDPVMIWLTELPGCSSELAIFYENMPFIIANNMSLAWNKFGWDTVSDYFNDKLAMLPWCRATLLQELNFVVDVAVTLFRNPLLHF